MKNTNFCSFFFLFSSFSSLWKKYYYTPTTKHKFQIIYFFLVLVSKFHFLFNLKFYKKKWLDLCNLFAFVWKKHKKQQSLSTLQHEQQQLSAVPISTTTTTRKQNNINTLLSSETKPWHHQLYTPTKI